MKVAATVLAGWLVLAGSTICAQTSSDIKLRDVNRAFTLQDHTDQNDPQDKKRNVHCKTYVVEMRKSKGYAIELFSNDFNAYLRLEDKNGTELASNYNSNGVNNAKLDFAPPKDGTYRIMVESVGGATGRYTFSITPEDAGKVRDRAKSAIEAEFKRRDRNKDGFLDKDEMPSELRGGNFAKWDKNNDGKLSLEEFMEYRGLRAPEAEPAPQTVILPPIFVEEDDLESRPSVYRAGKLPPGLPDWFKKLDTDGDGQVALWEWRKGGKSLEEFLQWDLNEDGFITAEEALRKLEVDRLAAAPKRPG